MKSTKIHILGDSTAAQKLDSARPESGWGEHLGEFLNPEIAVYNCAQNGLSTKSCIESQIFSEASKHFSAGDYLLIQFGHNDQKIETPNGTTPFGEFLDNLNKFISAAYASKVTPILLTSVTRRDFINNRLNKQTLGDYPAAMRQLSRKKDIALIDMYSITQSLYATLGEADTKKFHLQLKPEEHPNYPDGVLDNTHFNQLGAATIAYIVSHELKRIDPTLVKKQAVTPAKILFPEILLNNFLHTH